MAGRRASIDIGTNTVRLLVAEADGGRWRTVREEMRITRLGDGVDAGRRLSPAAIDRTVEAVAAFAAAARKAGAEEIRAYATSAARDAANRAVFLDACKRQAGVRPRVVSGADEARLAHAGVVASLPLAGPTLILDIGGGSTEFIETAPGRAEPLRAVSIDVGSVRQTERHLRSDPPTAAERAALRADIEAAVGPAAARARGAAVVGVAGSVTTLWQVLRGVPFTRAMHGEAIPLDGLEDLLERLYALPTRERRRLPGMVPERAETLLAGGEILRAAIAAAGASAATVSLGDSLLGALILDTLFAGPPPGA